LIVRQPDYESLSSQKPAKIAINCSPVEAMKYAGAVSGKAKKEF